MSGSSERYDLSPKEAAAVLGCHEDTLKRWAAAGHVHAFRSPTGRWKFRHSDLEAFLAANSTTGPVAS